MSDVKEKLLELLMDKPFGRATEEEETEHIEDVADYLVANGVTVQEWIPVTERLPEPKETPVLASHIGGVWNCLETLQLLGTAILDAVAPTAEKENNDG